MGRKLSILPVIFFLLLPAAFAQTQSHPLSQVTPIDTNLDMFGYNLTNAGYLLYNTGIVAAGTRGIPTADIQASAVTGAKIAAGVVSSSKLANPLGGSINASAYYDSDNSTYYLDPAGTGNSLVVAGSIGIGNTTPALKLHISHTSFPQLRFQDTQSGGTTMDMGVGTTGFGIRASNLVTPFIIEDNNSVANTLWITSGKVGINTTTPANTLNVVGDINATGTIYGTVSGQITGNATGLTCTGCVGTNELASSAVTSSKIASGAIGSTQLANPIGGSLNATMYYDSDNSNYYLDPAGATSLNTAGNAIVGGTWLNGTSLGITNIYPSATDGDITFYGHMKPSGTRDLGGSTVRWRDLYLASAGTIKFGGGGVINDDSGHVDIYSTEAGQDFRLYSQNRGALTFGIDMDTGYLLWGSSGDVNLYRGAVNVLSTDDSLGVGTTKTTFKVNISNSGFDQLAFGNTLSGTQGWMSAGDSGLGLADTVEIGMLNTGGAAGGIGGGPDISGLRLDLLNKGTISARVKVSTTNPTAAIQNVLDDGYGNMTVSGNLTLSSQASLGTGYKMCWNGAACTVYTYYNGTCVITQGSTSLLAVC